MPTRTDILRLLADGEFHSGTEIGAQLGVTRAAVCKGIKGLTTAGVRVHRVAGRGYRLASACTLLDADAIRRDLGALAPASLEILDETDSTNRYLLQRAEFALGHVCLAERQTAGRGRRGRGWVATPYRNIMMSIGWRFDVGPAALAGLSLVAGIAVVRALAECGVSEAGLKWPNDVLVRGRKLAGLLIDVRGEVQGPASVVLGIGLNVALDADHAVVIDQPWIDLASLQVTVDRNHLAACLIRQVYAAFTRFAAAGLPAFVADWERLHVYTRRPVRLLQGDVVHHGIVQGIDDRGGLVLEMEGGCQTFHAGEVSLRAVS